MFDADFVLFAFAAVVTLFVLVTWARVLSLLRADAEERKALDEWWATRRQRDTSSLLDDSPSGPPPDEWTAPCGEVVKFPSRPQDAA